jgi:hypothetical protein
MVMKKPNKILVIIALSMIAPSAYSGSLDDGIAAGDVLSSVLLNNAKAAINDNDSRTTALEEINGQIRDKISALENADSNVNGEVTRLGDDVDLNLSYIKALESVDGLFNGRIGVLEGASNGFTGRVTDLETDTSKNTADVVILQSADNAIRVRLTDIDGNNGDVKNLNNRLDSVEPKILTLETEKNSLLDRVSLMDGGKSATMPASYGNPFVNLESDVQTLQSTDTTLFGRLNNIDGTGGTVNGLKGRLDAIDGDGDSNAGSVNGLRTQLEGADNTIKGRLDAIDGDGNSNAGSVNGLRTQLEDADDTIKGRLDAIDGDGNSNAGSVNGLRTQLVGADNTIKSRLDAIDGNGNTSAGSVNELVTEDDAIKSRLDAIDGDGISNAGSVNGLRTQLVGADDTIKGRLNAIDGNGNLSAGSVNANDNRITTLIGTDAFNAPVTDTLAQIRKRVGALDGLSDCGINVSICGGSVATVDGRVDALPQHLVFPNASPTQGTVASDVWPVGSTFTRQSTGEIWMATELYENSSTVYWAPIAAGLRYELGDVGPGGGWVYRVSEDGFSGSEAYKQEPTLAQFGVKPVRYPFYYLNIYSHMSLTNTWALVALGGRAAGYCNQVSTGVGRDPLGHWFLPSYSELTVMLQELGPRSPPGGALIEEIKSGDYLSSSMLPQSIDLVYAVETSITGGGAIAMGAKSVDSVSGASLVRCGRHF